LPHDAHREHNLQVLRLLPQQLELPCDVDVHAQDPLSLHVAHTVPETKVTHIQTSWKQDDNSCATL
jgi:hypothetical protein